MKKINLIRLRDNSEHVVEPLLFKRKGTELNYTLLFKLTTGHRITPFEFKKFWKYKNGSEGINLLYHIVYSDDLIKDLVYASNPFLAMIPKGIPWSNSIRVPFKI